MLARMIKTVALTALASCAAVCLAVQPMLADRHVARGLDCASCHNTKMPQPGATVDKMQCSGCHGSLDDIAAKQKDKKLDPNPHYNHLVDLSCNECHKGHQKPVNMCNDCHQIPFKVP